MTTARKKTILENRIGNYHCTNYCAPRAFLCGLDALTGKNYEHRRTWIGQRLAFLGAIFAVDIIGYAVQSDCLQIIARTRPDSAQNLTNQAVALRWLRLFPPSAFKEDPNWMPNEDSITAVVGNSDRLDLYRKRLADLSWFMRCLNENIARLANREDDCKGPFWRCRFRSKLLKDEAALSKCMVDLGLPAPPAEEAESPL